jgi:type III restriction enzyme
VALHIQDDVRIVRPTGNLFLTNIHRVYLGDVPEPSLDDDDLRDYFLSPVRQPAGRQDHDSARPGRGRPGNRRTGRVQRRGAPHPRQPHGLVQCIQDIHHRMLQKDLRLTIQVDVTATPQSQQRRDLRADRQRLPAGRGHRAKRGQASGAAGCGQPRQAHGAQEPAHHREVCRLPGQLGVEEWRKSYAEHEKLGKKAVLFVMVDDTKNCDEVGLHLEKICPELQGAVLVIHTKANGEISEAASSKSKDELEILRKAVQ